MKKSPAIILSLIIVTFSFFVTTAQQNRPKIGLTLSGGGARGLAHIGILKAIDSAGLKIDYITGTSMGAVIGSLYAIGYSADSIEKIARSTNWDVLLSNQAPLRTLFMEEKDEYDKYALELPWVNNRFRLPSGVFRGQELWIKLSELFFPVYNQKDFSKFSIPFKCIGTDVSNGEAVVMDKGELTNAIRASMAIPSFFTPVDYDGKTLIDGGVVRNFPARDVKDMGANYIIGSNVSGRLQPADKQRNAIQILLQVAFFREQHDQKEEVTLCNTYIPFDLEKYNMGSFNQANEILEMGIKEGRKLYPHFKHLADSINAIYGKQDIEKNRLPSTKSVKISSYAVKGLENTNEDFLLHTMDFLVNHNYTIEKLSRMVRLAYGTRYYSNVTYTLEPLPDSTCKIVFDVTENPLTFAKLGLHYNRFTGIGAILNITSRNFFITNSRSMIKLNIGESFRARAEHLQYLGRHKNFSLTLAAQYDLFELTSYHTYEQDGLYKQQYVLLDSRIQYSTLRNLSIAAGQRFESLRYNPEYKANFQFKGTNNFPTTYFRIIHNSLDKTFFPTKGLKINSEFDLVYRQNPKVGFYANGQPVKPDSLSVTDKPYSRLIFNLDSYTPFSSRVVLQMMIQSGANFNYRTNIMNEFSIGGLTNLFHNQVLFAGLQEGSLYTPAMAAFGAGLRYEIFNNSYITGKANILFNNFISQSNFFQNPNVLTGYALTYAYNFALGPLELSLMYCDQSKKLGGYINIGIPF